MKVFRSFLLACLIAVNVSVQAQEMSPAAKSFKANIITFLREGGYTPTTEANSNTIGFKKDGKAYTVGISGSRPIQVTMYIEGFDNKDANLLALLLTINKVNENVSYVKTYITSLEEDGSTLISIEMPAHTEEDFRYVFSECVKSLAEAKEQLTEEYSKSLEALEASSAPFKITGCKVANQDRNGKNVTPFGNKIYSYNTRYLTPRLTIQSEQAGTYTIYYKLFTPDEIMSTGSSSPSGYTSSCSVRVVSGTKDYELRGWGSNTAGHWKAGNYKYEFYCDGASLGYYEFTIY